MNLTGLSGAGMMYLALKKGLDVLLSHSHADSRRVAVTGLSGGGWQTDRHFGAGSAGHAVGACRRVYFGSGARGFPAGYRRP